MGIVYLARDVALDVPVAVKILRPELATAEAAQRFVREAQTAAKLRHPDIASVHFAGERGGLYFYVMDYIEAPTLAQHLERGPVAPSRVVKLGRDLLDALEHAHAHGIVHRDIKPSNIFLGRDRALLGDFGIAKAVPASAATGSASGSATGVVGPTAPGVRYGTEGYMPPEQVLGGRVTPRTDIYAVGIVLYEALTKRRWPVFDAEHADWSGVPLRIARVLHRALEFEPERRWPDAATFRRALWRTRVRTYQWRTVGLTALGLVVGAGVAYWLLKRHEEERWPFKAPVALRIRIEPFQSSDGAGSARLADSVANALVASLKGYPDFSVDGPKPGSGLAMRSTLVVSGTVRAMGDSLRVAIEGRSGRRDADVLVSQTAGAARRLDLVVDTLTYAVMRWIWNRENPLDPSLPAAALPKTARGLDAWLRAERLLAQAQWVAADLAYQAAEAVDSTCLLCIWRHAEVLQWLAKEVDPSITARYMKHIDSFPPLYRVLMTAPTLPERARLERLKTAAEHWRESYLASFMRGDELYHRGPLVGHARAEAIEALQKAAQLRPDFAPTWEGLTWAHTAEGDSAAAEVALESLRKSGVPLDPFVHALRALLTLGVAWRFYGTAEARRVMRVELGRPEIVAYPDLAAGPRYLMTFDTPRGAIELGADFAARPGQPELVRSGLIAQVFGYVALGMTDSAFARAATLADRFPDDPNLALLGPELDATLLIVEQEDRGTKWASVRAPLERQNQPSTGTPQSRQRAAWMLAVLAHELGDPNADRYRRLFTATLPPQPLTAVLVASEEAGHGDRARALAGTDPLTELDASELLAAGVSDPFFRAVLHLLRAQWQLAEGNYTGARRELLWYQANDYHNYPTADVQVGDVDAGFGTDARWRLATMLDGAGQAGTVACHAYAEVRRLWTQGDPRYRARADSAAHRLAQLHCTVV